MWLLKQGLRLKKVVLELGGSDPYLILADADLEQAAEQCVVSRLSNAGQICISAKRIIVVEQVKDEFIRLVLEKSKSYISGDPLDPRTKLGPLAREDLRKPIASTSAALHSSWGQMSFRRYPSRRKRLLLSCHYFK